MQQTDKTIALTILQQLGGNKFRAMTGMKHGIALPDGLSFRLPSGFARNGINYVKITLTPMDDYDMEFMSIRGLKVKSINSMTGIYADMLQSIFTNETGLDTHL